MSAAVAAILGDMPDPSDLRLHKVNGRCVITAGPVVLFDYDGADVVMRNLAISALRRLGFTGRRVAALLGLTENYVATLPAGAARDRSAALIQHAPPARQARGRGLDGRGRVAGPGADRRRDRPAPRRGAHHGQPAPRPAAQARGGGNRGRPRRGRGRRAAAAR
jgi:hypothetical protein